MRTFLLTMLLTTGWLALLNTGSACAQEDESTPEHEVELTLDEPRSFHEIHSDIRAFFKRDQIAENEEDRVSAILDLCAVYDEIKRDPRLSTSRTLQGYRGKVWRRLIESKEDVEKRLARQQRRAERRDQQPAQQTKEIVDETTRHLVNQMTLTSAIHGGPALVFSQSSGAYGGGVLEDYGDDLVRLIQRTISPDFWDINGGPGTIVYYRPLHALVVRATSEIHGQVGNSLDALRRAGGR